MKGANVPVLALLKLRKAKIVH